MDRQIQARAMLTSIAAEERQMKTDSKIKQLRTTVGDLIAAIMDVAVERSRDKRAAYRVTSLVVNRMLQPVPVVATRARVRLHRNLRLD